MWKTGRRRKAAIRSARIREMIVKIGEPSREMLWGYANSRYYDEEGGDPDSEEEEIQRQMEEQEEAENADDLDARDMAEPEPGVGIAGREGKAGPAGSAGLSWPAPN